jgi:hypothetical protein
MAVTLPNIDWKRFWVPRDGHLALDDNGFLADPEGKHGPFLNPDALSFESVSSRRCAVLLGEPGIGKSTELKRVNRQGTSAPAAAEVLELNLKDYSSDTLLVQDLFGSQELREWEAGSHELLLSLVARIGSADGPQSPRYTLAGRRSARHPSLREKIRQSRVWVAEVYEPSPARLEARSCAKRRRRSSARSETAQ